ncbi:MAG: hypothetical protein KC620_20125 [Myxococcales bacterium]|nr:hypothetical protein [Myxococcales bacterium]
MRLRLSTPIALCAALLWGCADEAPAEGDLHVTGLSTYDLVVGQSFAIFVNDPAATDPDGDRSFLANADLRVLFEGRYTTDDGRTEAVAFGVSPLYDGLITEGGHAEQVLRVSRFGPYTNPFTATGRPGVFDGTVTIIAEAEDGTVTETRTPRQLKVDVGPSLLIEEFQPVDAECAAPALRALPGLAYKLSVRAVGLKPVRFIYEVARVNGVEGTWDAEHRYETPTDRDDLGVVGEPILFNPVPEGEQFYTTGLRIIAEDAQGNTVETALPVSVHRPIEVVHSGKRELAERYEPVPVSGCIPGSIGSQVSYSETVTEFRQQSVSVTVSRDFSQTHGASRTQDWQEGISEGETRSRTLGGSQTEDERTSETIGVTYGHSEANNMNFSSSDGESWSWSRREGESNTDYESRLNRLYGEGSWSGTVGASAEGSIPGFAKVSGSVSTTLGVKAGGSIGADSGQSRTRTSDRGFSMSGSHNETTAFGSTVTDTTSENISGTFALTRARQRSYQDSESRSDTRTWNFSNGVRTDDIVAQGDSESENRTWVESASDQTVQAFTGLIPRSKVGLFYRQTTRWVRRAEVRAYNQCGLAEYVGELQFNEWTWAPDLAIGESCGAQPPASNLEAAACFIAPCG